MRLGRMGGVGIRLWRAGRGHVLAIALLVGLASCRAGDEAVTDSGAGPEHTVVDLVGRHVVLPVQPERIGCLTGASYEKAFLVGAGERVAIRAATYPPWMEQTNPRVRDVPTVRDSRDPALEFLLAQKLDVLFFWDDPLRIERLKANGIAALVPQPARRNFKSIREFTTQMKDEVLLYGQVLGEDAERRARAWCSYYDEKVRYVLDRTSTVPEERKPKVYYVRGPDSLTTHGRDENITWYGTMAGARMVVREAQVRNATHISMEEILGWDPDVVFVGRQYSADQVLKDRRWRDVAAVRNHRVFVIPDGVFYWDSGSEGILLLEYLAGKLHEEVFRDLDMRREVRDYYERFYGYRLTEDECDRLLSGLDPEGKRLNRMNN